MPGQGELSARTLPLPFLLHIRPPPNRTRLCLLPFFFFYNILILINLPLLFPFSHPLHLFPPALLGPSCPSRALIYSSHILHLPLFSNNSQHPWHLYSRKLIIVSSTQAPFYRPNCIGFLILNSFVFPNLAFPLPAYDPSLK